MFHLACAHYINCSTNEILVKILIIHTNPVEKNVRFELVWYELIRIVAFSNREFHSTVKSKQE